MIFRLSGLWQHSEFKKLWAGQAISLVGTQVMFFSMAVTAVTVLNTTPIQMGILLSMQGVPALFGLVLGAWADRRRKLPIVIGVDLGRAVLLLVAPAMFLFDLLTIEVLYVVAFGIGSMGMLFHIGYRSLLPSVVDREDLIEANSKLEIASSGSLAVGPVLGGVFVQVFAAPFAFLLSSISFLISGGMFWTMHIEENPTPTNEASGKKNGEIRAGLSYVLKSKSLIGSAL